MPTRNRIKLQSNFKIAKDAAHDGLHVAIDAALTEAQDEAQKRIRRVHDQKGYELDAAEIRRKDFPDDEGGMIYVHSEKWYYRFFEYGTVFISASPFMRPAHRKMRRVFKDKMEGDFEKWIRRRVRRS